MGYSTNPALLEARRPALAELEAGRACRWVLPGIDLTSTRRRVNEIREALYIASLYPHRYPTLAAARDAFSIHIVGPGVIEARPKSARDTVISADTVLPSTGTQPWGLSQPTVGITTAREVIDSWRAHLPSNDPIHFAQTTLPIDELKRLYIWASGSSPKLMLLVGDGFLTLALHEIEADAYAWTPPAEQTEPEPDFDL